MKHYLLAIALLTTPFFCFSQEKDSLKLDTQELLKEFSNNACKCADSVSTFNKSKKAIAAEIHSCIDKQVSAYQMVTQLAAIKDIKKAAGSNNKITVNLDTNPNSQEYKKHYYQLERYLMNNCNSVKDKMAVNDEVNDKSLSSNPEALKYYNQALDVTQKGDYGKAIDYYKKAVVFDPEFTFAYDNMGICYRRLEKYDEAIEAYEKSLKINPNGSMPLQNIAVAYIYKQQYKKAVKAYERLAELQPENPEAFFGIGNLYATSLFDYEKALDNLCQAYNIYIEQKSPYRSDAEKLIQGVYLEMKKQGKEELFKQILKKHNISTE